MPVAEVVAGSVSFTDGLLHPPYIGAKEIFYYF